MKCVLCGEVKTDGASVGLVQSVCHLPHLLRDVWRKLRWALEAAIRTAEQSAHRSCVLRSVCVKGINLRPRKRLLLLDCFHL